MEPVHSLCLLEGNQDYKVLYDKISKYAADNYAIVYAAEADTTNAVRRMRQHGIDVEDLVESGALVLVGRDDLYSFERTELDGHALMNTWHTLMLGIKRRSNFDGILAIGSAENFLDGPTSHDKLLKYEEMIGKKFAIQFECVCCYSEGALEKLSFGQFFSILNSHFSTVHDTTQLLEWNPKEIVGIAKKGIVAALGGDGVADLFFSTLRLCYRLTEEEIVTDPIMLENLLLKVLGRESHDRCVRTIKAELRKRLSVF